MVALSVAISWVWRLEATLGVGERGVPICVQLVLFAHKFCSLGEWDGIDVDP